MLLIKSSQGLSVHIWGWLRNIFWWDRSHKIMISSLSISKKEEFSLMIRWLFQKTICIKMMKSLSRKCPFYYRIMQRESLRSGKLSGFFASTTKTMKSKNCWNISKLSNNSKWSKISSSRVCIRLLIESKSIRKALISESKNARTKNILSKRCLSQRTTPIRYSQWRLEISKSLPSNKLSKRLKIKKMQN